MANRPTVGSRIVPHHSSRQRLGMVRTSEADWFGKRARFWAALFLGRRVCGQAEWDPWVGGRLMFAVDRIPFAEPNY